MNVINGDVVTPFSTTRMRRFIARFTKGLPNVKTWPLADEIENTLPNHDITVNQLIEHITKTVMPYAKHNREHDTLCARVIKDHIESITNDSFMETTEEMADNLNPKYLDFVRNNHIELQSILDRNQETFEFDFFGITSFKKNYLFKREGKIIERPQYTWLRVATFIAMPDLTEIEKIYKHLSMGLYTHATPTLYNAGMFMHQLSSCFLLDSDDSIDGMYDAVRKCANISKCAGGIGICASMIRSRGSYIHSTNGVSSGILPYLKLLNQMAVHVDQAGKRKGAIAVYLEVTHPDIYDFLAVRQQHTAESIRCPDIHIALMIPDLFMRRVRQAEALVDENSVTWSLMDPNEVLKEYGVELYKIHNGSFDHIYEKIEKENKIKITRVPVMNLFREIIKTMSEAGEPYIHFKDSINRKNNQGNVGPITCSNLCSEIMETTVNGYTAVCNLASISLPSCIKHGKFDFHQLINLAGQLVRNLDSIIDRNHYPLDSAKRSNMELRPIGIGVQGLADVFQMLDIAWEDPESLELNNQIFECIYFGALKASVELARDKGTYPRYKGSMISAGRIQPDLWDVVPSGKYCDWGTLRVDLKNHGVRNSLMTAMMPTASTSQILGNTECFEPLTNNMYTRSVLSGCYYVFNKHLYKYLEESNLLTPEMILKIEVNKGSVQTIEEIPEHKRKVFKTVWEIPMKRQCELHIGRAPFIDQSQSANIHYSKPDMNDMASLINFMWVKGAKTCSYYTRRLPEATTVDLANDPSKRAQLLMKTEPECTSCSG